MLPVPAELLAGPSLERKAIDALVRRQLGETRGATQQKPVVTHRAIAMYLMHERGYSLALIGMHYTRTLRGKTAPMHHTTVLAACTKVARWRKDSPEVDDLLRKLEGYLQNPAAEPPPLTHTAPKPAQAEEKLLSDIRTIVREELKQQQGGAA